jgi:hypothetical protein
VEDGEGVGDIAEGGGFDEEDAVGRREEGVGHVDPDYKGMLTST